MKRLTVEFETYENGASIVREVRGQTAKALVALVDAGSQGITALGCGAWAFRLAAYCFDLRKEYGLAVRTDREDHEGGWHGRHVLETPVRIVRILGDEERAAA
jgi:hypothetical protein